MPDVAAVFLTVTLLAAYVLALYLAAGVLGVLVVGAAYAVAVKLSARWWGFPPPHARVRRSVDA